MGFGGFISGAMSGAAAGSAAGPWGALAGGLIGGLGGSSSENATNNAAKAQIKAANKANELQRYMYDTSRADSKPWLDVGSNALYAYSDALGLDRPTVPQAVLPPPKPADLNGAGRMVTGYMRGQPIYGDYLPKSAASTAPIAPTSTQPAHFNALEHFRNDPGYQFQLEQGQRQVDRGAAAAGNLGGGHYMKDLLRFSQGLADTTYNNYLNRISDLSGHGQTQSSNMAQLGSSYANASNANTNAAGAARASGYLGNANTLQNTLAAGASLYASGALKNPFASANTSAVNLPKPDYLP